MKRPASMFYWADHQRDHALRASGLAAQGLWVQMLGMMHDGQPYGHLTVAGKSPTDAQLARMLGESAGTVKKLLAELEANGVFSRTDSGIIYSRRMVRDEHKRTLCAEAGKRGGNPSLMDKAQPKEPLRVTDKPKPTPSVAVAVSNAVAVSERDTKSEAKAEESSPLAMAIEGFIGQRYSNAPADRQASIRKQLASLRVDGVRYKGNSIKASSDRHLIQAIRATLQDNINDPDKSISVLLLKLSTNPELDSSGQTITEGAKGRLDASNARIDRQFQEWEKANPVEAKAIRDDAAERNPGNPEVNPIVRTQRETWFRFCVQQHMSQQSAA